MTDLNRPDSSNLDAVTAVTGVIVNANRIMGPAGITTLGCTLASVTTYFFPFGAQHAAVPAESLITTVQLRWDAAAILTITVETTVFPSTIQAHSVMGPVQLSDFDATAGYWLQQNPTTAYVPTTGGTATAMTVAVAGGSAGGCEFDLGNLGSRRGRVRVAVGGTGGVVRCGVHGKGA